MILLKYRIIQYPRLKDIATTSYNISMKNFNISEKREQTLFEIYFFTIEIEKYYIIIT